MTVKELKQFLDCLPDNLQVRSPKGEEVTCIILFNGTDDEIWLWLE